MKKSRILGYALTLAATLFVGSAIGQKVEGGTNFKELKNGTLNAATKDEDESYVQKGKAYKFYAKPDASFHPGYIAGTWTLTSGFTWTWTMPDANYTFSQPALTPKNYVEITAGAAATTALITVQEIAPATWGTCSGSNSTFSIVPFAAPTFAPKKTVDESVDAVNNADAFKKFCASVAANAKVLFSLSSSGTPHIKYKIEKATGTIAAATGKITPGAFTSVITSQTKTFNAAPADSWNYDVTATTTTTALVTAASGDHDAQATVKTPLVATTNTLATYDIAVQYKFPAPVALDPVVTVYRIYLEAANGLISRKGDYKADGTMGTELFYDATGATGVSADQFVDFYVTKAPSTGPVFHIGNNVAK